MLTYIDVIIWKINCQGKFSQTPIIVCVMLTQEKKKLSARSLYVRFGEAVAKIDMD